MCIVLAVKLFFRFPGSDSTKIEGHTEVWSQVHVEARSKEYKGLNWDGLGCRASKVAVKVKIEVVNFIP